MLIKACKLLRLGKPNPSKVLMHRVFGGLRRVLYGG
jgi:hypothetical protein